MPFLIPWKPQFLAGWIPYKFTNFIFTFWEWCTYSHITLPLLKPSPCETNVSKCSVSTLEQEALLDLGLYTVAMGYGGYQPCISSFRGNQFDKEDPLEQKQASTFFSWYYMSMMVVISAMLIVYVEDSVSWSYGCSMENRDAGLPQTKRIQLSDVLSLLKM
ncbi:hypothetical protein SELMODRAFT_418986 [Selaginella moellendorffii]|uniref:Uncharacterized protein n=1 Tax=Selaginella moellendorffii TaxID=88036 RepID=D8S7G0_SELML|nr:hypothetical protein SELMODRAFT_418986 [Selaginella moellendorffii]